MVGYINLFSFSIACCRFFVIATKSQDKNGVGLLTEYIMQF